MSKINAVCQECGVQFEYDLKPGFPRKYCFKCSEVKKAAFSDMAKPEKVEVQKIPPSNGQSAMYVSYAKDIFVALLDTFKNRSKDLPLVEPEVMDLSIQLVKQAQDAF